MKIFISQPMRGKTDAEILAERERAIKAAKAKWGDDVEVLESFFPGRSRRSNAAVVLGGEPEGHGGCGCCYRVQGVERCQRVQGGDRRRRSVQVADFLSDRR